MNDELLMQGEYADIIIELLNEPYNISSVPKLVFIAFCVRHENKTSYSVRKTDFVDALLSNLSLKLLSHSNEMKSIFEVLNKLKKCGWVSIENGKVCVIRKFISTGCKNRFLSNCKEKELNPIIEVNRLDDKAFVEEVLRYV